MEISGLLSFSVIVQILWQNPHYNWLLTALNADTGKVVWEIGDPRLNEAIGISQDSSRVFVKTTRDESLLAYSATSDKSKLLWETEVDYRFDDNESPVNAMDGAAYYALLNGEVIAVNSENRLNSMIHHVMKRYIRLIWLLYFLLFLGQTACSQENVKWWNPEKTHFDAIEGQGWHDGLVDFYDRLPQKVKNKVRKPVWDLSKDAAGLKIRFRSDAKDIYVRYGVKKKFNMPHMPSTGVSGLDLYALDENGKWQWTAGNYNFGDTIRYHFSSLPNDYAREYHLYLPLYNHVKWLEIGVSHSAFFRPLRKAPDKPIVVYGTSIAQGATASRPGRAWTAILQRKLNRPLINLGFSGNGRLEKPIVQVLTELDPKLYVIDCLPNMGRFPKDTVAERLKYTIRTLREEKPDVPVLMVEDADASIHSLSETSNRKYEELNRIADSIFIQLKKEGLQKIYLLSAGEISLDIESTVDGVHPNDYGMELYAVAYEKKIREILNEPKRQLTTTKPVKQYRDKVYDWNDRHRQELEQASQKNPPKVVFIGNSITHYWGGEPLEPKIRRGVESWNKYFNPAGVRNLGFGWDRIENVLWRVYHGELEGYKAKQVLINIGTNNLTINSNKEIIAGLELLIKAVKYRQPKASIVMIGIYPRKGLEDRVKKLNKQIAILSAKENVFFTDPGVNLLDEPGKINTSYFQDKHLHPNAAGYEILGKALKPYLL